MSFVQQVSLWSQSIAGFTALSIGLGVFAPTVRAATDRGQPDSPDRAIVAQERRDLCRQVFRERSEGIVVYQSPDPTSPVLGRLLPDQQVQLVPDFVNIIGPDGANWLQITGPVQGYIANGFPGGPSNLVYCSFSSGVSPVVTTPVYPTPIPDSLCRRVIAKEGLAIRQSPDLAAARVGGVGFSEAVQLDNLTTYQSVDGRLWVSISYPTPGFISSGFASGGSNLGMCGG
jgi:hypothetical protein